MIKIILADDDLLTLTKLKTFIHLQNACISGSFTSAEEAIAFLAKNEVQILITDMKMPKIDGIGLIRAAKELWPEIEVIAISSYKDFHYVKDSFKEGSIDYILKHTLNEEILMQALLEAQARILKKGIREKGEEASVESREALQEKLFTQLFQNQIEAAKVREILARHQIRMDIQSSILIVCEIDDYARISEGFKADDKRIFLNTVRNIMERIVDKVPDKVIVSVKEGTYVLFLSFTNVKSRLYILSMSTQYCKRLNENIKKIMNEELSVGMGQVCSSWEDLKTSYEQCTKMLKNKFFEGKGRVYSGYQPEPVKSEVCYSKLPVYFQNEQISRALAEGDLSCLEELEKLFNYYKEAKLPIAVVDLNMVEMLNTGFKVIEEEKLDECQGQMDFQSLYKQIKRTETVDEMKDSILLFYRCVAEEAQKKSRLEQMEYSKYTIQALQYIRKHYKEPLSLQDIAEQLGVHYAYLSKIFKSDVGANFSEYLNKVRIDKAKKLIESKKYRIKDVYSEVGFSQYNYFFKVFKQMEGCTPIEYEKKC